MERLLCLTLKDSLNSRWIRKSEDTKATQVKRLGLVLLKLINKVYEMLRTWESSWGHRRYLSPLATSAGIQTVRGGQRRT